MIYVYRRLYAVRGRRAFAVGARIFLLKNRLEKLALPLAKNEVGRFGSAPLPPVTPEVLDVSTGVRMPPTRAGRSQAF
jgi:hypothetical protein